MTTSVLNPAGAPEVEYPESYVPNVPIESLTSDELDETDGYHSSEYTNATQSITSSVLDYVYENGRRYHSYGGEGKYVMPNDEAEKDRLDLSHHLFLMILRGELHTAPVKNPARVLDCGTGTGIWALDFANSHPESVVYGVDLSPIQPSWVYPNVKFEVDDLESEWTWPPNHFDYIHCRAVITGIRDYERLVRQTYKHVAPGGWVELIEYDHDYRCEDDTMGPETAMYQLKQAFDESSEKAGIKCPKADDLRKHLEDAGFEDVSVRSLVSPWGAWAKDKRLRSMGAVNGMIAETGLEAYCLALFTRYLGWEPEKTKALCAAGHKELISGKVHVFQLINYAIGRKPAASEEDK